MTLDPGVAKAFDFAQEASKQLISLATAIIALTITFLTDVVAEGEGASGLLKAAWVLFLISVLFGVVALLAMTGNLERPNEGGAPTVYSPNIVLFAGGQVLTFVAGLVLTLAFGFQVLG